MMRALCCRSAAMLATAALLGCRDTVGPGTMVFVVQPRAGVAGEQIEPEIVVSVLDAYGEPVAGTVTIALDPNPCGWLLSGTRSVQLDGGNARFGDLSMDKVGPGYTLRASSGSLSAVSQTFTITSPVVNDPLVHQSVLCTKPNSQQDAEGLTSVPEDDALWLGDDDGNSIFEVDRSTGHTLSSIGVSAFLDALPDAGQCDDGDGDPNTTCSYTDEFEQVAYDPLAGYLYVVNTVNDSADRPAIFRLRKQPCAGCFAIQDWQPLPLGTHYDALGVSEGKILLAVHNRIYDYDYASNHIATVDENGDSLPPLYTVPSNVVGLGPQNGTMWILTQARHLYHVLWSTKTEIAQYDLAPFSISTPRGVEMVRDTIYVTEGDAPNPINVFTLR